MHSALEYSCETFNFHLRMIVMIISEYENDQFSISITNPNRGGAITRTRRRNKLCIDIKYLPRV